MQSSVTGTYYCNREGRAYICARHSREIFLRYNETKGLLPVYALIVLSSRLQLWKIVARCSKFIAYVSIFCIALVHNSYGILIHLNTLSLILVARGVIYWINGIGQHSNSRVEISAALSNSRLMILGDQIDYWFD